MAGLASVRDRDSGGGAAAVVVVVFGGVTTKGDEGGIVAPPAAAAAAAAVSEGNGDKRDMKDWDDEKGDADVAVAVVFGVTAGSVPVLAAKKLCEFGAEGDDEAVAFGEEENAKGTSAAGAGFLGANKRQTSVSVVRNRNKLATAPHTADIRLALHAGSPPKKARPCIKNAAQSTNSGYPGGCALPRR